MKLDRKSVELKHKGCWAEMVACCWLIQNGYDVFKNISQHGLIDIIALRDGKVFKFDVKSVNEAHTNVPPLSQAQAEMGILALAVYADGRVKFCEDAEASKPKEKNCLTCKKVFSPGRRNQIFCSDFCQTGKKRVSKVCAKCGAEFIQKSGVQLFCTQDCASFVRNKRAYERKKAKRDLSAISFALSPETPSD